MEPKWTGLAERLRDDIESERITEELPSESELVEKFGVSRTTVRKALTQLTAEGLIDSSQGSRRRVRQQERVCWPMHSWEKQHNTDADAWALSIRSQGGEPSTVVTVAVENAGSAAAKALGIAEEAPVVVRHRTRSVDGHVHQLADSYFPYELVKNHPSFLTPGDQSAKGGLLAAAGMPQTRYLDVIESRMPSPDEARQLRVAAGTPLLIHRRTGYAKDGTAVRYMITRMSADRVEISYEVKA